LKKLSIDLKNDYAATVAGGDFVAEFIKIDFAQFDLTNSESRLYSMADDHFRQLFDQADIINLVVPMRYSMIKLIEIDTIGFERYGQDFLTWEAGQQLPEELGKFHYRFHLLGKSFDGKKIKMQFWAAPEALVDRLIEFSGLTDRRKLALGSEAMGLYLAIDKATESQGFNAAIILESDGASAVISHDGDFVGGKFILDSDGGLGDELMYYIFGASSETLRPQVLLGGDLSNRSRLGDFKWGDTLNLELLPISPNPEFFIAAYGLNLID
jgi:hypothetical protein